jgi:flagellar basal-body rod protein FlgC
MRISNNFLGFDISAAGLSVQRKKMNLIAENIANANTTKTEDGTVYKKKYLAVQQKAIDDAKLKDEKIKLKMQDPFHFDKGKEFDENKELNLITQVREDQKEGDLIYQPDHPDADENGYVRMPNVNIITEMVDMIAASRAYEANLTALNTSKQLAKDSLEI